MLYMASRTKSFLSGILILLGSANATFAFAQEEASEELPASEEIPATDETVPNEGEISEPAPEAEGTPPVAESPAVNETPTPATDTAHHGLLGPVRVGPTASIGFPFLLNYSLDATWDKKLGFSFSGGRFHTELDKNTEIEIFNWDARVRWFPFQGSFFLGAAYGNQGIVGKTKQDLKFKTSDGPEMKIPTSIRLELNTNYLTPHLGWFATWNTGFTIGTEFGYQMPLGSKAKTQTAFDDVSSDAETSVKNSEEYKKAVKDLEEGAEAFGKNAVPYLNLFRIGWLF